ncbi:MAG: hypothetical protein WB783_17290, partial [Arenicellales bacterium]
LELARRPFYSALIALTSRVTGMTAAHGAYVLNTGLFAVLVLGYAALVETLGAPVPGGRPALWMAAFVVLLYPALNGFRSFVAADVGYWACYVWSLAWFMHHAETGQRRSLSMWALAALAALLFSLEALVFLVLIPAWEWARGGGRGGGARVKKVLVVLAGIAVLVVYALWQQAWQSGAPAGGLLRHPLHHLVHAGHETVQGLRFKLEGLRSVFLDQFSRHYDAVALLTTVALLSLAAVVRALGLVYAAVAAGSWLGARRMLPSVVRYWWGVFLTTSVVLLLVPAFTRFQVTPREAMTAALTVSAIIPLGLDRARRLRSSGESHWRWLLPAVLVLVLVSGAAGLYRHRDHTELRQAGLWLRSVAPPGRSVYSNSRVVVYYSGLRGNRPESRYTWQEAMRMVWSNEWRRYDYLAVVIDHAKAYRRGILIRDIQTTPLKVFANSAGDRVLIFSRHHQ